MKKIGDILIEAGLISRDAVSDVLAEQELSLKKFGEILIEKGLIDERKLIEIIAAQSGHEFVPDFDNAELVKEKPDDFYWKNCCALIKKNNETVFVFNVNNAEINSYITALSFKNVKIALSIKEQIYAFLSLKAEIKSSGPVTDDLAKEICEALEIAIIKKSSNIRIKKGADTYSILLDTDAGIEIVKVFSVSHGERIINIIANMCKTQLKPRKSLEAKFEYTSNLSQKKVDIRVEFLPASGKTDDKSYFEAVLRIHGLNNLLDLKSLGFSESEIFSLRETLTYSSGLILSAGPTGAGKSTTFYAILKELAKKRFPILTIEDPVEIKLNETNISQMSVDDDFRYDQALTAMLRCEPKIILVGEIRDKETAVAVLKAAQTGHLVLSTIHTQSALNIISRIKGLGVEMEELLEVVKISTSQRLYLPLCPHCKEVKEVGDLNRMWHRPLERLGINIKQGLQGIRRPGEADPFELSKVCVAKRGEKCDVCFGTGYVPKKAIIEILSFDDAILNGIRTGEKVKYETLKDKAFAMLKKGEMDLNQFFGICG